MESITKNRQSSAVLKQMIAKAYGADQVPDGEDFAAELGHGWFNVAYEIWLKDSRHVVLKIAPPADVRVMRYEDQMMANELVAIRIVKDGTSVPVPRIDFQDTSRELCDAFWFFMPFIEADNFGVLAEQGKLTAAQSEDYFEQLGSLTAQFNQMVGVKYGPVRDPQGDTWREEFVGMIEGVLQDGEDLGVDIGWDYSKIREVIAENAHYLDDVTEPRYCEWDMWDSNAMVRDGKIVALIDHERAIWADPLIEAGFTAMDLPEFGNAEAFNRGYGLVESELTESERQRRRLYTLYLILIMVIETRFRGHQDDRQYDGARINLSRVLASLGHG